MTQLAEITIQYVNRPNGRGPGTIKDSRGGYWQVWSDKIGLFNGLEGQTVTVMYQESEYRGKPQYTILGLVGDSGPQAPAPRRGLPPRQPAPVPRADGPRSRDRDEDIAVLAMVKEWIPRIQVGDREGLLHALKTCRSAWRELHYGIQQPAKPSLQEEMNDEIPDFDESQTLDETFK